jgi:hypothetical protein
MNGNIEVVRHPERGAGCASIPAWVDGETQARIVYEGTDDQFPGRNSDCGQPITRVLGTARATMGLLGDIDRYENLRLVSADLEPLSEEAETHRQSAVAELFARARRQSAIPAKYAHQPDFDSATIVSRPDNAKPDEAPLVIRVRCVCADREHEWEAKVYGGEWATNKIILEQPATGEI